MIQGIGGQLINKKAGSANDNASTGKVVCRTRHRSRAWDVCVHPHSAGQTQLPLRIGEQRWSMVHCGRRRRLRHHGLRGIRQAGRCRLRDRGRRDVLGLVPQSTRRERGPHLPVSRGRRLAGHGDRASNGLPRGLPAARLQALNGLEPPRPESKSIESFFVDLVLIPDTVRKSVLSAQGAAHILRR
jgi:hypothetical protein